MAIFEGSDIGFGRTTVFDSVDRRGKIQSKSWTVVEPIQVKDLVAHIEGRASVGLSPINSSSLARWGAIDVDIYKSMDFRDVVPRIAASGFPFVPARSKSGGLHLFLFLEDWVPAGQLLEYLSRAAACLGLGSCEIFPKQVEILPGECGNWINLPYFNKASGLRFAFTPTGEAVKTVEEFARLVEASTLSIEAMTSFKFPELKPALEDGPPCLNHIYNMPGGPEEHRNTTLCNTAAYLKRARPETWEKDVWEFNEKFNPPLPEKEVRAIIGSYKKRDYKYQCSTQPLCTYCDVKTCRQQKYGVGDSFQANNKSLTVVLTTPPIWYLDVPVRDGKTQRISLTTEELQNPRLFQKRCMETIFTAPEIMKQAEWAEIINQWMSHLTKIEMPPEASPEFQLIEHLDEWLTTRATDESIENLARGIPFKDENEYLFRMADFERYLSTIRFLALKRNQVFDVIKNRLNARKGFAKILNKGTNYWAVTATFQERDPLSTGGSVGKEEPF